MRNGGFVGCLVVVLVGWVAPAFAETPTERRLRVLEEQLHRAQQEIDQLKGQLQQQKAIGQVTQKQVEQQAEERAKIAEAEKKAPPIRASYAVGKGFTFKTDDDRFELSVFNRLQARYTFVDQDAKSDAEDLSVGSSRVDLQACKLEYSIVSPK